MTPTQHTAETSSPADQFVTQFDGQLLPASHGAGMLLVSHTGASMCIDAETNVWFAGVTAGADPRLLIWKNRELITNLHLPQPTSPAMLVPYANQTPAVYLSIGNQVYYLPSPGATLQAVGQPTALGVVLDAAQDAQGRSWLAVTRGGPLEILCVQGPQVLRCWPLGGNVFHATLDIDDQQRLHLALEANEGIDYRRFDQLESGSKPVPTIKERAAEAFGFYPVILAQEGKVFLAYLGESCRLPGSKQWHVSWQRLGRGGYIAGLVRDEQGWSRQQLADSRQIVNRLRPTNEAYGGGPHDPLLIRVEEFSPPSLSLGPDGVVQVVWANQDRRYAYASRFLGREFSPAAEVRGPLESLTGPAIAPRRIPLDRGGIPLAIITRHRAYLDELVLPPRRVARRRTIDFLLPDELASSVGLELALQTMRRHPENPVIPKGAPGLPDHTGIVADIQQLPNGRWSAIYITLGPDISRGHDRPVGIAHSEDGIHWTKQPPGLAADLHHVQGQGPIHDTIRFVRDDREADPAKRYKGLYRSEDMGPWSWTPVVSADGKIWRRLPTSRAVHADDDLRIHLDEHDIPTRRFKASAISRSHCGRVCAMWTSADGMHWEGYRNTLNLDQPFQVKPNQGGTGRIIVEAWSGPEDEDEVHGGYLFHDGDRWLCHYMKWTADGHIYPALAASRDGLNFTRVAGGLNTLPLGLPGQWDSGRIALRESPFLVDQQWRQYYTGCGWKHGLGGVGAKTSHVGANAPNQMGLATIGVGRWAGLQVRRGIRIGTFTTVPLQLAGTFQLLASAEGLDQPGQRLQLQVLNAKTDKPIPGYEMEQCDAVTGGTGEVPVTWAGRDLRALDGQTIRLSAQLTGYETILFNLVLQPVQ